MNTYLRQIASGLLLGWLILGQAYAEELPASSAKKLFYFQWFGRSPGAEPTHTSLEVIEVDLTGRRFRRLNQAVEAPMAMLPHDQEGIEALVNKQAWHQLSEQRTEHLAILMNLWQETDPPKAYKQLLSLGREDGFLKTLQIQYAKSSAEITFDARGRALEEESTLPPPEWHALFAFLQALHPPAKQPAKLP